MKQDRRLIFCSILVFTVFLLAGCTSTPEYDPNKEVPSGEPPFPPQKICGVVDPYYYLSEETIQECQIIIDDLKEDGIAEITVLIQEGVKDPEPYATHYGRYIGLGEKGKNNGLVWLIRPDVKPEELRMTYSVGRGLPKLTSSDLTEIMQYAADPVNFGNYDSGVFRLVKKTDERLREIYG